MQVLPGLQLAGTGIAYAFGLGPVGAIGVGVALGLTIGFAYATTR